METSPEFKRFGLHFIQDIDRIAETSEGVLEFVLRPFKGEARVRLRAYLTEIISERVSDAELQRLRNATPSDIFFYDASDLRKMLTAARDRI